MITRMRRRTRPRDWLALAICLLLVALINASARGDDAQRWYTGTLLRPASSPNLDVAVTDVELSRAAEGPYSTLETTGVFVIVHWSVAVKKERAYLSTIQLHTNDGLQITQRDEFKTFAAPPIITPGFTGHGTSVFEVPAESAAGADLVIAGDKGMFFVYGYSIRIADVVDASAATSELVTVQAYQTEVTQ